MVNNVAIAPCRLIVIGAAVTICGQVWGQQPQFTYIKKATRQETRAATMAQSCETPTFATSSRAILGSPSVHECS